MAEKGPRRRVETARRGPKEVRLPSRPRIFVSRELPGDSLERLRAEVAVDLWPQHDPPPVAAFLGAASAADGLLTMVTERVDVDLLDVAPSVRIVSNMAVGYDNIDVPAATARGIAITNTPGVLTETTADLAFALILGVARRLAEGDRLVRNGGWGPWHPSFLLGRDVHGATLGIVGLGAIGQAVARRARGFEMRLLHTSRAPKPEAEAALGVEWRELDGLLAESDYVLLTVALTAETRGLIGARELGLMKPSAYLVNVARGGIVDQAALTAALARNAIAGAALDVTAVEPLPPNDPLLAVDNLLVTPHIGSASIGTRARMASLAVDNVLAFFRGERPPFCVNPEVLNP
jgi:glyoxylate reductase